MRRGKRFNKAPRIAPVIELAATPKKADLKQIHSPYQSTFQSVWTPEGVRGAIAAHYDGDFSRSARLADAMMTDSRYKAAINNRVNGLLGSAFELQPTDGTEAQQKQSEEITNDLLSYVWDLIPEHELRQLLTWKINCGIGIAELNWETGFLWLPKVKVWHPQYLRYDFNLQRFILSTKEGQLEIDPNDTGSKWIIYTEGETGFRNGTVCSLGMPWLAKNYGFSDWLRWSERHGGSIIKLIVPANAEASDKDSFFRSAQHMGNESCMMLPAVDEHNKFDVDLLEAKNKSYEGFEQLIRTVDDMYSIEILGQNLTTMIDGGSRSAAEVHADIKVQVHKYDSMTLGTCLRDYFFKPIVAINYTTDLAVVPYPCWDVEPPADVQSQAKAFDAVGAAVTSLKTAGIPVDEAAFAVQFNIPVKEVEQKTSKGTFVLAPTDIARVVSVNEARQANGLGDLLLPDGSRDPNGDLTISDFDERKKAAAQQDAQANPIDPVQEENAQ